MGRRKADPGAGHPAPKKVAKMSVKTSAPTETAPVDLPDVGTSTDVVRRILAPYYVQQIAAAIGNNRFSAFILLPESKKRGDAVGVVVKFLNQQQKKLCVANLGLHEIEDRTPESVLEGIERAFELFQLKWRNLVGLSLSGVGSDADQEGLLKLIREKNPNVFNLPRLFLDLESAVRTGITDENIFGPQYVELIAAVYHFFRAAGPEPFALVKKSCGKNIGDATELRNALRKIQEPIVTQYGFIFPSLRVLSELRKCGKDFFKKMIRTKKKPLCVADGKKQLVSFLENPERVASMVALDECCQKIGTIWDGVEKGTIGLLEVGPALRQTLATYAKQIFPIGAGLPLPEKPMAVTHYDEETKEMLEAKDVEAKPEGRKLLSLDSYLQDFSSTAFIEQSGATESEKHQLITTCRRFISKLIQDLRNSFFMKNDFLLSMECLKPVVALNRSGNRPEINALLPVVHPEDVDEGLTKRISDQWLNLPLKFNMLGSLGEETDTVTFWCGLMEIKDPSSGLPVFTDLSNMALSLLTLPFAGGAEERQLNSLEVMKTILDRSGPRAEYQFSLLLTNARLITLEGLRLEENPNLAQAAAYVGGKHRLSFVHGPSTSFPAHFFPNFPVALLENPLEVNLNVTNLGLAKIPEEELTSGENSPDHMIVPLDEVDKIVTRSVGTGGPRPCWPDLVPNPFVGVYRSMVFSRWRDENWREADDVDRVNRDEMIKFLNDMELDTGVLRKFHKIDKYCCNGRGCDYEFCSSKLEKDGNEEWGREEEEEMDMGCSLI